MNSRADFVAVVTMAALFMAGGSFYVWKGVQLQRQGGAWHRLNNRPMTRREWQITVGALLATGAIGLLMGLVVLVVALRRAL